MNCPGSSRVSWRYVLVSCAVRFGWLVSLCVWPGQDWQQWESSGSLNPKKTEFTESSKYRLWWGDRFGMWWWWEWLRRSLWLPTFPLWPRRLRVLSWTWPLGTITYCYAVLPFESYFVNVLDYIHICVFIEIICDFVWVICYNPITFSCEINKLIGFYSIRAGPFFI